MYLPHLCQDKGLKGIVVNRICLFINGKSLEISITVPLIRDLMNSLKISHALILYKGYMSLAYLDYILSEYGGTKWVDKKFKDLISISVNFLNSCIVCVRQINPCQKQEITYCKEIIIKDRNNRIWICDNLT